MQVRTRTACKNAYQRKSYDLGWHSGVYFARFHTHRARSVREYTTCIGIQSSVYPDGHPYLHMQDRKLPISRGAVVASFLSDAVSPEDYIAQLPGKDQQTGGYNVLCGNTLTGSLWAHSNRADQGSWELPAGLHAVSNGPMTTEWEKMRRGRDALPEILQAVDAEGTLVQIYLSLIHI